ncbi:MAG: hypothetical protein SW833_11740 [Cyanobacteriota bacterium]|nr:hypothetical protein [Cyanobacteriota bacterium]
MLNQSSPFQRAIEAVEALPLSEREILLALLQKRLADERRKKIAQEVAEVHQEYERGQVQFGSVANFLAELDA